MHSNDYATVQNFSCEDGVVQQSPLPQSTFLQLSHIMDLRMVVPLLEDNPDAVVHQIQIRQTGWPHLWGMTSGISLCSKVTCLSSSVNGMISLMSTLHLQVWDVRDMYVSMLSTDVLNKQITNQSRILYRLLRVKCDAQLIGRLRSAKLYPTSHARTARFVKGPYTLTSFLVPVAGTSFWCQLPADE